MQQKPSKIFTNYVIIGSGFSAAAAVSILIKKKIKPLILDIGTENFIINSEDKAKLPLGIYSNNSFSSLTGFENNNNTELLASHTFGGLSRVWGGCINKMHKNEYDKWPIKYNVLEKYYKHIDNFFSHLGFDDNYSKAFNLKKADISIRDNRNKFYLNKKIKQIFFGNSREAVDFKNNIFSLNRYFTNLIRQKKIYYIKNFEVTKIKENSKKIIIFSKDKYFLCNKLYIASGPLATAKILLNSFKKIKKISLKETSLISSFWFVKKKINNYNSDRNCDFFLTKVSRPFFSSQIYILKNSIIKKIFSKNSFIIFLFNLFLKNFQNKFVIILSYLDEHHSNRLVLKKINNNIYLKFISINTNFYSKVVKILKSFFLYKLVLIFSVKKKFGYGYHFGSSYPMSLKANHKFSDILGRVNNLKNVHIIDSSVLPQIPISTITYTLMANAARIVDKTSKK